MLNREVRCNAGTVPPLYQGAWLRMPLELIPGRCNAGDELKSGDLPSLTHTVMTYGR